MSPRASADLKKKNLIKAEVSRLGGPKLHTVEGYEDGNKCQLESESAVSARSRSGRMI